MWHESHMHPISYASCHPPLQMDLISGTISCELIGTVLKILKKPRPKATTKFVQKKVFLSAVYVHCVCSN